MLCWVCIGPQARYNSLAKALKVACDAVQEREVMHYWESEALQSSKHGLGQGRASKIETRAIDRTANQVREEEEEER